MALPRHRATLCAGELIQVGFLCWLVSTLGACDTATLEVREDPESPPSSTEHLGQGEAVVAVRLSTSEAILQCVDSALRKADPEIALVPPHVFREALYPWFEPNTAPSRTEELARLLARPLVKNRIAEIGVRYVVAISGQTTVRAEQWGGAMAAGGYPRGVGFALTGVEAEKRTEISAAILDLKEARSVSEIEVSAEGEGSAGVFIFIPYVFLPPATEAISCQALAERILAFLSGPQSENSPD